MSLKLEIAKTVGSASEWGLKHVFKRPAANFPGKVGLYADPNLIEDLRPCIREGIVVVVGTNGKTTVTNLIADTLEVCGFEVVCNRTGANLDSGVATALLEGGQADWGVLECDELWLARIAPQLKPTYIVLLNLFRDQLDRAGEIALIQESIVDALKSSPETILVFNADDPFCQGIANRVSNPHIAFGIEEDLGLPQNSVVDSDICQQCDTQLDYAWRQYGQLGNYKCPNCEFSREAPVYQACEIETTWEGASLTLRGGGVDLRLDELFSGAYMIYNALAAYAATDLCGAPFAAFEHAVRTFNPQNGRLERYDIDGTNVMLNLAKNPTGFNQNLQIIMNDPGPKAVAFFINDKEADGHDVSWLWDVDFQVLVWANKLTAFAGGLRRNDMQVRLKYAGIDSELVDGARDFLIKAHVENPDATCYLVANYTALPMLKSELDHLQDDQGALRFAESTSQTQPRNMRRNAKTLDIAMAEEKLTIVHLYPKLLNLYGDGGNVKVLAQRATRRGICTQVLHIDAGQEIDLSEADIVFLGGGPDREQRLASQELIAHVDQLRSYVEDDGVLLAICGGYQILGREWFIGDETIEGLGIIDAITRRGVGNARNRLVGNIVLESPLSDTPVIGYENHAGRTYLGRGCKPFGAVARKRGSGNNDHDGVDGVLYRNVLGTYLHGPLLTKNPEIADFLLTRALERRALKENRTAPVLSPLDDTEELAANAVMRKRLGIR